MPKLNTLFAGSPEFAADILRTLIDSEFCPQAVITQPDRPKGRGRKLQANAVKQLALEHGLPVEQPESLKNEQAVAALTAYEPDVIVVAAYGLILPKKVLQLPRFGCINVHASLLPRWRGAAPIERAIMAGDSETGVCIMHMEEGLDTGPVYARQTIAIEPTTTPKQLEHQLAMAGSAQLMGVLAAFAEVKAGHTECPEPIPQNDELATYAEKLTALDRRINWQDSAQQIARQVRAMADKLPVRTTLNDCGVQFLAAQHIEQALPGDDGLSSGTLVDASKAGLIIQCATDLLQVTSLKVERGKGKVLDPAAAINGFKDLFYPGAKFNA